jgi:hypothetical protein
VHRGETQEQPRGLRNGQGSDGSVGTGSLHSARCYQDLRDDGDHSNDGHNYILYRELCQVIYVTERIASVEEGT